MEHEDQPQGENTESPATAKTKRPRKARAGSARSRFETLEAENAALKAALANPRAVIDAMITDAPGSGIPIIGEGPRVTGGMTLKQQQEKIFGKSWWVKVTETALPFAKDVHQVASFCNADGGTEFVKLFRANTEVLLPESEIKKLEEQCIVIDRRQVSIGEGGMELAHAKALNTGMDIETDSYGQQWLVRKQPRFYVQRLRPEQESITLS